MESFPGFLVTLESMLQSGLFPSGRKRVSRHTRLHITRLAKDLELVACGIRQACLVEGFSLNDMLLIALVTTLRNTFPLFGDVIAVFEGLSAQTFFVNIPMLRRSIEDDKSLPWTAFLQLNSPLKIIPQPRSVTKSLQTIIAACATQTHLPEIVLLSDTSSETLIPLAGYLLEYPISYCPSAGPDSDSVGFLGGVELRVFNIFIAGSKPEYERTLINFSCPVSVNAGTKETLWAEIQHRWHERLVGSYWHSVNVNVELKTLDRVAL